MTPEARIEQWFQEILAMLNPRRLTRLAASFDKGFSGLDASDEVSRPVTIPGDGQLVVVAIGKAAIAMAAGAQDLFGDRFERGYVLTVDGPDAGELDERWTIFRAGHPIPDERGIDATQQLISVVEALESDDMVVALISGGGSALFEAPCDSLSLADFAELTQLLLNAGAPIQHLNAVRIPLSQVKGGSFRQRSPAGTFVTLMLSDVLGNDPAIIASGPTVKPATSAAAALSVLDRYGLRESVAPAVRAVLQDAAAEGNEWDHPNDMIEIVGDLDLAITLAEEVSRSAGFSSTAVAYHFEGEASEMAREWIQELLGTPKETDVVWGGGENIVTVRGAGSGGRNTEFALAAALELDRLANDDWIIASLATDGQDGTSRGAGAIASRATIVKARELGIDPKAALAENDSATFFEKVGGLVITGPSGTNVNDLYVGFRRAS